MRPTTDRAKESLFNIIENHFEISELTVLDLFSGTGNMAYEFCSRGAASVTAVDLDFKCVSFIKSMKEKHQLNQLKVIKRDAFAFLRGDENRYQFIFADAPYAHQQLGQIPDLVQSARLLIDDGWLVVEHESNLDLSHKSGFFDKRIYGQSAFSFFKSVIPAP